MYFFSCFIAFFRASQSESNLRYASSFPCSHSSFVRYTRVAEARGRLIAADGLADGVGWLRDSNRGGRSAWLWWSRLDGRDIDCIGRILLRNTSAERELHDLAVIRQNFGSSSLVRRARGLNDYLMLAGWQNPFDWQTTDVDPADEYLGVRTVSSDREYTLRALEFNNRASVGIKRKSLSNWSQRAYFRCQLHLCQRQSAVQRRLDP